MFERSLTTLAVVMALAASTAPALAASKAEAAPVASVNPGFVPAGTNLSMVFANVVPGTDAEFGVWYDKHMQDMIKLPGFVRAQRFQMQPRKGRTDPPYGYLIIYEFNGDPDTILAALGPAVKEGRLQAPDPRFVLKVEGMVYKAIQPGFQSK